ncbi:MAG TPA: energy transducer TonB [Flavobacterium sp.]|uniref:energy transducer TonB family protein n=1 Tax=Flavobacterium sp. TaxID=239 RepID=UPI002D126AFC|nr:energy transducer TonB [Flavobacterium sp.]HSD13750.1 energy transducer TonB [Flavobacterium sp.]
MKLKENDSLQFQLSYLINKSGYIVADSTAINSGIASFDNYIKLMVKSLPKFTPAVSLITKEHSEYKINILCEFVVKNNKLMIFEKNKIDNFEDPITPIFEACAKDTAVKKNCLSNTYKTIAQKIDISKLSFREALNEIKIMVVFSIDEHGKATDIKILRSSIESKELENKIIEAFLNLPKFYIPTDDPNFHKKKISLPITFQINNTGYSGRPYRNSNGYH